MTEPRLPAHPVNRWHASESRALRESQDDTLDHAQRVCDMAGEVCAHLGIDMSPDLGAACWYHDTPEAIMGDWPATLTRSYRVARWAKAILEWQIKRQMGLSWRLTRQEALILSLCDTLDAVMWARDCDPGYFARHFKYDVESCRKKAAQLGVSKWLETKL